MRANENFYLTINLLMLKLPAKLLTTMNVQYDSNYNIEAQGSIDLPTDDQSFIENPE